MSSTKRAAIYCRISRDRTGSEAGVGRQETDCRAHVERHGWDLIDVFTDNDLSAYSGKPRPSYERLLGLVVAGAVDVIVAWHPDRLTRHPKELERIIDTLDAAGCTVDTVMAGRWDLSTRSGRTQARLVGVVARDESEAKSERLTAMHEHKARAGEYRGGRRHYGYQPDGGAGLVVVEAEAAIVRECARRVLAGEAVNSVVNDLNARAVPTVRGLAWRVQTLKRTLTSWTICGRREYQGEDIGDAVWPGIIDRPTRDKLHRILNDPDRSREAPARVSLLASLVRCADCGAKMITGRKSNGVRIYTCPATTRGGCGGPQINAGPVDELVGAAVVAAVDGPGLDEMLVEATGEDDPSTELEEIEADLEALADDFGHRRILRREWMAARAPLESARDEVRAKLAAGSRTTVLAPYAGRTGALAEAWPDMGLDRRRAIVAAVVDRVVVARAIKRGPVFDPGRVSIEWRA